MARLVHLPAQRLARPQSRRDPEKTASPSTVLPVSSLSWSLTASLLLTGRCLALPSPMSCSQPDLPSETPGLSSKSRSLGGVEPRAVIQRCCVMFYGSENGRS